MQATLVDYDWISFSEELHAKFSTDSRADERIIECVYDPSHETTIYDPDDNLESTWDHPKVRRDPPGGWKYERMREDKNMPNDMRSVESIKQSVADGVTQSELLEQLGIANTAQLAGKGFVGM